MEKNRNILWLILMSFILAFVFSCRKLTYNHKEEVSNIYDTIPDHSVLKHYFVPYGEDSVLMIPYWLLVNLYGSPLEPWHKLYKNEQDFGRDFLYSPNLLPVRIKCSYHFKLNKQILQDYSNMSLENFFMKYTVKEGNDTILLINDTTIVYCLDKHDYFCIFNYNNTGKNKIIGNESWWTRHE